MRKSNRIMMIQNMVNTLAESVREYENFEVSTHRTPLYGDVDKYHTKESIKRRIMQARAELLQLEKEL